MVIIEECSTCDYWGNLRNRCYLHPSTPITKAPTDRCSRWKMLIPEGTCTTTASYTEKVLTKEEATAIAAQVQKLQDSWNDPVVSPSLPLHGGFWILFIALLLFFIVPFIVGQVVIVQWLLF